jgi:hypothetical protein
MNKPIPFLTEPEVTSAIHGALLDKGFRKQDRAHGGKGRCRGCGHPGLRETVFPREQRSDLVEAGGSDGAASGGVM